MMYSAYKLNKQGDNIQPWGAPFPIWNQSVVPCPVLTVASWPAYRFPQDAGQMVWYYHLFQNFPQFIVIHTKTFRKRKLRMEQGIKTCSVTKSCPSLCNTMECSLLGYSVHGILQAGILECIALSFSRGSSQPGDWTWVSCIGKWIPYHWAIWETPL